MPFSGPFSPSPNQQSLAHHSPNTGPHPVGRRPKSARSYPAAIVVHCKTIQKKPQEEMDSQLEFSSQAYCKMVMHTMKYPHSVCSGLLLSPKPTTAAPANDNKTDDELENNQGDCDATKTTRIIEAIPVTHNSHYLAPNIEVALNSVSIFAQEQELVISGYYQTEKNLCHLDVFGQRVTERIAEFYSDAVLCFVGFDDSMAQTVLNLHHLVGGKWRSRPEQSYKIENDPEVIAEKILYSKEKLFRKIVDFDDHFNDISQDWTNLKISQRIDHLVANIC